MLSRRAFLKASLALAASTLLPTPPSKAEASLEERLVWEELFSMPNPKYANYVFYPNYGPPTPTSPALFIRTMPFMAPFFSYPTQNGSLLVPLLIPLFTLMPPGYKREAADTSFFPSAREPLPPLTRTKNIDTLSLPLQPLPSPFTNWDGIYTARGVLGGEPYLFAVGRLAIPTIEILPAEDTVELRIFDFYAGDRFSFGIGIYTHGKLEEYVKGKTSTERITIQTLVESSFDDMKKKKNGYPLHYDNSTLHLIRIRLPRSSQSFTIAYTSNLTSALPQNEKDVKSIPIYGFPPYIGAIPTIPLLLRIIPSTFSSPTRITPPITLHVQPPWPEDEATLDEWLDLALLQLGWKKKKSIGVKRVIAYPQEVRTRGLIVSAIYESPPPGE